MRFDEDVGLPTPARAGRNHICTHRDRTRLKLTLRGNRLGLSSCAIRPLVDLHDSPSDTAPRLQALLGVLAAHRRPLEHQRQDIGVTFAEIARHAARRRVQLAGMSRKDRSRA